MGQDLATALSEVAGSGEPADTRVAEKSARKKGRPCIGRMARFVRPNRAKSEHESCTKNQRSLFGRLIDGSENKSTDSAINRPNRRFIDGIVDLSTNSAMPRPSPRNCIDLKLALTHLEVGLEQLCDELMLEPSSVGRTRLMRVRLQEAWQGRIAPYKPPSAEDRQRWLTSQQRVVLSLRFRAEDPASRELFAALAELPDNRSRVSRVKRLLFEALYEPMASEPRSGQVMAQPGADASQVEARPAPPPTAWKLPDATGRATAPLPEIRSSSPAPITVSNPAPSAPAPAPVHPPPSVADPRPSQSQDVRRRRRELLSHFTNEPDL